MMNSLILLYSWQYIIILSHKRAFVKRKLCENARRGYPPGGTHRKQKIPHRRAMREDFCNQNLCQNKLYCSLNKTGAQAACAGIYSARSAVDDSLYLLDLGLIGSVAASVRVGYLNTEGNALAADFAFCHLKHLPLCVVDFFSNVLYFIRNSEKMQVFLKYSRKLWRLSQPPSK